MTASRSRTPEPVATVAKALATLRSFVDGQSEWGVRELGAALEMPPSTVHRLLARLRIEGFVGYDPLLQKYNVGFEFARLAAAVMQRHDLRQVALPVMRDLTERTGEGVWLALYDSEQHRIAYIAESESPHASRYIAPLGRVNGMTDSACGIAVLAGMSNGERQATLRALRLRLSGELGSLVSSAVSSGYAVMRASEVGSAMMVAAGVRDADGTLLGSIAFVVPMHRLGAGQERRLGEMVGDASRRLSLLLGAKLLGGASVGSWQDAIGAISGLLREKHPALEITPALGGGGRNLDEVDRGMGAYGLTVASSLFDARKGRGQFAYRHERLRTVMHLSDLHFLIIVRADLQLKRPADLARLRVSPGEQGFSGAQAFQDVLGVAGVDLAASSRRKGALVYLDYPEGRRQFEAGNVDAVAWMTTVSNPLVRDLEMSTPSRLFALDPGTLASLLQMNPGYRHGVVRSRACPRWLASDMATLSVPTVLACRADRPEGEVYDFARTIFERRETLGQLSPVYEGLDDDMVLDGLTAPLHPGAERFFDGLGIRPRYARQRSIGNSARRANGAAARR
jgi:IclR family acetate operon transcriptional repressor